MTTLIPTRFVITLNEFIADIVKQELINYDMKNILGFLNQGENL